MSFLWSRKLKTVNAVVSAATTASVTPSATIEPSAPPETKLSLDDFAIPGDELRFATRSAWKRSNSYDDSQSSTISVDANVATTNFISPDEFYTSILPRIQHDLKSRTLRSLGSWPSPLTDNSASSLHKLQQLKHSRSPIVLNDTEMWKLAPVTWTAPALPPPDRLPYDVSHSFYASWSLDGSPSTTAPTMLRIRMFSRITIAKLVLQVRILDTRMRPMLVFEAVKPSVPAEERVEWIVSIREHLDKISHSKTDFVMMGTLASETLTLCTLPALSWTPNTRK
jgi:hypothetical protein